MRTTPKSLLVWIAAADLFLVAVGTFAARSDISWLGTRADTAFLMFAVAAVGLVTFFGLLLYFCWASAAPLEDRGLRVSITVAVVTVYLVVVGEAAFWTTKLAQSNITELMLTSFTSIVGVVVAFFFGSSAYVEVKKRDAGKSNS